MVNHSCFLEKMVVKPPEEALLLAMEGPESLETPAP